MTLLLILGIVSVVAMIQTVRSVLNDGQGHTRRPPVSHFEDPQFRSPAAR
ncbi:hypothetical protein [Nocardioides sp. SYSU D00038]|nr:hypothetical protein [Nocardioides sp. SYSU D00038]